MTKARANHDMSDQLKNMIRPYMSSAGITSQGLSVRSVVMLHTSLSSLCTPDGSLGYPDNFSTGLGTRW